MSQSVEILAQGGNSRCIHEEVLLCVKCGQYCGEAMTTPPVNQFAHSMFRYGQQSIREKAERTSDAFIEFIRAKRISQEPISDADILALNKIILDTK